MAVALLGGFGPGLLTTAASALLVDYWLLPPTGRLTIDRPVDAVGVMFFSGMGLFMSTVAALYRRAQDRAAAYACRFLPRTTGGGTPALGERLLLRGG